MHYELKTFKFICDICKEEFLFKDVEEYRFIPKGWVVKSEGTWGLDITEYCPDCYKKELDAEKIKKIVK